MMDIENGNIQIIFIFLVMQICLKIYELHYLIFIYNVKKYSVNNNDF